MAENPQITQTPITAPVTNAPAPNVQTPATPEITQPATPIVQAPVAQPTIVPVIPPVTQPVQPVPPLQNIVPHPITPAVAAQLTVDMNTLTAAVDKAYGRE